jgi:Uma2 family endonuclease
VEEHGLGEVMAAETGFRISRDPETVRAPDVAFVTRERFATIEDDTGFLPLAPDLAVEVISPSDAFSDVEGKAFQWIDAGTRLVLVVDVQNRQIECYRSRDRIEVLTMSDTLDASDVVPRWIVSVQDLLGESPPTPMTNDQ